MPAFREDGSSIELKDLLSRIPENRWVWAILDFYGIGEAPNDLSMEDFETAVQTEPDGFIMTWQELKEFSSRLNQTYDCLIVASSSLGDLPSDRSAKENFCGCDVVIEAFDRTEWSISIRDPVLLKKFSDAGTEGPVHLKG